MCKEIWWATLFFCFLCDILVCPQSYVALGSLNHKHTWDKSGFTVWTRTNIRYLMKNCLITYPIQDTRISVLRLFRRHAQGIPPPILERGGLDSFGWILTSSNGKNLSPFQIFQRFFYNLFLFLCLYDVLFFLIFFFTVTEVTTEHQKWPKIRKKNT